MFIFKILDQSDGHKKKHTKPAANHKSTTLG